jgi:hypothetical protein
VEDEDLKLRLVNPAPEPEDPEERFFLALERLGDKAPEAGSLEWLQLAAVYFPPAAPDDPRLDPDKGLHISGPWGSFDRWPRDRRSPEKKARDNAHFQAGMRKVAASLRNWLIAWENRRVLPFRPKR